MGDHALFQNTSTAKRFPFLATVPQHELSVMFNVPPVDRELEKLNELQYSEPYSDPKISFRELSSSNAPSAALANKSSGGAGGGTLATSSSGGADEYASSNGSGAMAHHRSTGGDAPGTTRPAFIPANASSAKKAVLGTSESVFVGTYKDEYLHTQKSFAASQSLVINHRPFSRGGSSLAAGELISNQYYLNATDSDVARQVREMTKHRVKENRAMLQEQQEEMLRRNRGQSRGSDRRLPALPPGPRPMTGSTLFK